MLIEAISFEIRDFKSGIAEEFLIENTELHFSAIAQQRNTRNIKFTKVFAFQFAKERKAPKFIEFADAIESAIFSGSDVSIDPIDEMVGTF